jgi:hypothetical protein
MSDRLTRRNFLAAVGTAAVSRGMLSRLGFAADEPAQTPHSTLGTNSTLDYGSTRELVAMLANRKISAVELLEHAIARIEALDQRINAVVVRDFERAHSAAVAADAALARGERAPLLGLPMTVKEALNVTGMPTTWGMPIFKGWMPKQDSVVIARLKSAGAIIIGKTNVPFAMLCIPGARLRPSRLYPRPGCILRRVRPQTKLWSPPPGRIRAPDRRTTVERR